jgi:hypothetical protein
MSLVCWLVSLVAMVHDLCANAKTATMQASGWGARDAMQLPPLHRENAGGEWGAGG